MKATVPVAALLDEQPDESIRGERYDQQPYWELERSRIGQSRRVPVELIGNGESVARKEIEADGTMREISFDAKIDISSWVALPAEASNGA